MKTFKSYLVQFDGNGYFADKQYYQFWTFTYDPIKAKRYKTLRTAINRIKKAKISLVYRVLDSKIYEEIITFVEDGNDGTNKMITTRTIVHEDKKIEVFSATGETIGNVIDDPDDPFWG